MTSSVQLADGHYDPGPGSAGTGTTGPEPAAASRSIGTRAASAEPFPSAGASMRDTPLVAPPGGS
jgi:hypothetical protein